MIRDTIARNGLPCDIEVAVPGFNLKVRQNNNSRSPQHSGN